MKRYIGWLLVVLQCAGCATMFHGTSDQIGIRSNEPGTKIYIDEVEVGTDSAIWVVPKSGKHNIRVSKEGCQDRLQPINYAFDGVSLLGLLIDFGIISIVLVDGLATGAISRAEQTAYIITPACPKDTHKAAPAAPPPEKVAPAPPSQIQ